MITLVKPSADIMFITPLSLIEEAGRTCYKSEKSIGCQLEPGLCLLLSSCDGCEHHSSYKFCQKIDENNHESVMEHSLLTVRFVIDRGISHELVRHRLASFSQESTRYVNYGKRGDFKFIIPVWFKEALEKFADIAILRDEFGKLYTVHDNGDAVYLPIRDIGAINWVNSCINCTLDYKFQQHLGYTPEKCRAVLNHSLKTEVVMSANFREWRHIFRLRNFGTTGTPHPQMVEVMSPLFESLEKQLRVIFNENLKNKK